MDAREGVYACVCVCGAEWNTEEGFWKAWGLSVFTLVEENAKQPQPRSSVSTCLGCRRLSVMPSGKGDAASRMSQKHVSADSLGEK